MNLNHYLQVIEEALAWQNNVPGNEHDGYVEELVNLRREFKKIKFAADERCSTAAYGESQMGKSYLVSAMMSDAGKPFTVTDGTREYNFINDINPSNPNSRVEATGVVTRFTTNVDPSVPAGHLKARLLTVADVILMLCEAYHTQTDYDNNEIKKIDYLQQATQDMVVPAAKNPMPMLSQDDVLDIKDYLMASSMRQKVDNLTCNEAGLFNFLMHNVNFLTDEQLTALIKLLWFENPNISRLFDTIIEKYRTIRFCDTVYVPFEAILKKHGTLLDVARLDEIYDTPDVTLPGYLPTAIVSTPLGDHEEMPKGVLSALVAELYMSLPTLEGGRREFFSCLDILDFPGERRPESMKADLLDNGKNLSVVLRRGKVTYLFNKYSDTKRISSLMLCHNNMQSAESKMGTVLEHWVNNNVGDTPDKRDKFMSDTQVSPLFIISTFFNMDLEYQTNDKPGAFDEMSRRWDNRFKTVLEKEVLRASTDEDRHHWFNQWTTGDYFKSIFMLRDFKYSTKSFDGYNDSSRETREIVPQAFPDFMSQLKRSFVEYDFVQKHFSNPEKSWNDAATLNNDGTMPIIDALNKLAPKVKMARDNMFEEQSKRLVTRLKNLLAKYYHSGSSDDEIKKAKRQASQAGLQIGKLEGSDPAGFGKVLDTMMIDEPHLFDIIHKELNTSVSTPSHSKTESALFMQFGLNTDASREENLQTLCDQLGVDDEEECAAILEEEGININDLLNLNRMMDSQAERITQKVESFWLEDFMTRYAAPMIKDLLPSATDIVAKLTRLYNILNMHDRITAKVDKYLNRFDRESCAGIIADYMAMEFNRFVTTFGFDYISDEQRARVLEKNERLKLNIKEDLLYARNAASGVKLLEALDTANRNLQSNGYSGGDRKVLLQLPQYGNKWRWLELLKLGYVFACELPDYDLAANNRLGLIIDKLNQA